MAEQLGEARLKLSVDGTALEAGLQRAQQQAQQAGTGIEQAFTKSGKPIQKAANGLEYFIDANGRARKITGQFVTVAELQAAGLDKLAGAAGRAGTSLDKLKQSRAGAGESGEGGGGAGGLLAGLGLNPAALTAAAVGAAVIGIGTAAVQTAGQIQKLNAAFTGLTGSAQAAQQLRQDLFTLSKTTPFKNDEILTASQRFLAVGVNADKLKGTINRVGALAAQSGQPLERLALIYAQVYAKGRLQGEENLQFLEAGVDLTDELSKVTGKSGQALRDAMEKGQISIEDVNKAIVLATGNMSSLQQAGKAVDVAFNNIGDNIGQLFGGFATSIAPALSASFNVINRILEQAFPSLKDIEDLFKPLTTEAEKFAKALESNPELIAAIAAGVREWGGLIVDYVANGLRTVNNILNGLDSKTLVQGFINAELIARKLLLTLFAVGATAAKNAELAARAVTNPLKFAAESAGAGGFDKFIEKEYGSVREKWAAATNAKPLEVKVAAAGDSKIDGDLSSRPGETNSASLGSQAQNNIRSLESAARAGAADALAKSQSAAQELETAGEDLQAAAKSLNQTLRGGFEFLSPQLQEQQLLKARAAIQPLVDKGVIREGIDISTPDKLFRVAAFAEQLAPVQQQLEKAIRENTVATLDNTAKDTSVYVQLPNRSTSLPMPAV